MTSGFVPTKPLSPAGVTVWRIRERWNQALTEPPGFATLVYSSSVSARIGDPPITP
jgi:hypothetical protein